MNIGIDIRAIGKNRTGDEVYTTQLVKGLSSQNIDHLFYAFIDTEDWYQIPLLKQLPGNWKVIPLLPKSKLIWTEYLLPKACEQYRIDLLHIQYIAPLWLPAYTKMVNTIHDISWKFVPEYIEWTDRLLLNSLIPLSIQKSDLIITVSKHSKYAIQKIFYTPVDKVQTVYNGGYIPAIPPVLNISQKVRAVLQEDYILYLGSLQPRKNIPLSLKAYAEYLNLYPDSQLKYVIAGGKGHNYDKQIETTIQKHQLSDRVIRLGFVSEAEKMLLLREAKLFLYLSSYEGFGIPIIEAMSLGTPVIAADSSCLPEIVAEAGLLVSLNDIPAIAQAIAGLAHNLVMAKQYKEKGWQRASQFTWEKMVDQTYSLYKKVLLEQ